MIEQNLNSFFLPEKIVFQNEMTLDLAAFMVLINKFKENYKLMNSTVENPVMDKESYMFKDLKQAIVREHEGKEFFVELGTNTSRIIFYHGVSAMILDEEEDGMAEEYLKSLPISPLKNIRIPIAPLLKLAKEVGDKEDRLDFNDVKIVRIRDYDKHEEIELSIEEVINGSSE